MDCNNNEATFDSYSRTSIRKSGFQIQIHLKKFFRIDNLCCLTVVPMIVVSIFVIPVETILLEKMAETDATVNFEKRSNTNRYP